MNKKPQILLNEKTLWIKDMQVIGSDGKPIGRMSAKEALAIAKDEGLDLFVVSTSVVPPIAKIVDYGHMKYEQDKRERQNSKPKQEVKEVRLSPRIQKHDIDTLVKRAIKFLQHGDKVKINCIFKQREIEHSELGLDKINLMLEDLKDYGAADAKPTLVFKQMFVIVSPIKK